MAKGTAKSKTVRWGRFELTEAEIDRQISEATRRGEDELRSEPLVTSARFDRKSRRVVVELNKGSTLSIPVDLLQGLSDASDKDLARIEILNPGCEIEWPALDQQFSILGLLAGRFGTRRWMQSLECLAPSETATPPRKSGAKTSRSNGKQRRVCKSAAVTRA